MEKIIDSFFDFFSKSENVSTSRIYAQNSLATPAPGATQGFMKKLTVTNFLLEGLSYVIYEFVYVKSGNLKIVYVKYELNHAGKCQKRKEITFSDEKQRLAAPAAG